MKTIKSYNESIRDFLKPKSEEDIKKALEQSIIGKFEESYKNGISEVNLRHFGKNWEKYTEPFYLIENFYLYKDNIFRLFPKEQYDHQLLKYNNPISEWKDTFIKRKEELENAIKKLG